MLDRRSLLRGLVAAPAVVAIGSLMPIRGVIMTVRGALAFEVIVRPDGGFHTEWLKKQVFAEGPPRYSRGDREISRDEWRDILGIPDVPARHHHGHTAPAA